MSVLKEPASCRSRTAPPSTQGPSGPTSAASIYIGLQPGGVGTVNVSSTTANASTLKASDRIEIGSAGTAR